MKDIIHVACDPGCRTPCQKRSDKSQAWQSSDQSMSHTCPLKERRQKGRKNNSHTKSHSFPPLRNGKKMPFSPGFCALDFVLCLVATVIDATHKNLTQMDKRTLGRGRTSSRFQFHCGSNLAQQFPCSRFKTIYAHNSFKIPRVRPPSMKQMRWQIIQLSLPLRTWQPATVQ